MPHGPLASRQQEEELDVVCITYVGMSDVFVASMKSVVAEFASTVADGELRVTVAVTLSPLLVMLRTEIRRIQA